MGVQQRVASTPIGNGGQRALGSFGRPMQRQMANAGTSRQLGSDGAVGGHGGLCRRPPAAARAARPRAALAPDEADLLAQLAPTIQCWA